jgi:hypothetical protein
MVLPWFDLVPGYVLDQQQALGLSVEPCGIYQIINDATACLGRFFEAIWLVALASTSSSSCC